MYRYRFGHTACSILEYGRGYTYTVYSVYPYPWTGRGELAGPDDDCPLSFFVASPTPPQSSCLSVGMFIIPDAVFDPANVSFYS